MAFNPRLDKVEASFDYESDNGKNLKISVMSYNGGELKLQIGPRLYQKRDGSTGYGKAGRMTADEACHLARVMPQVLVAMGVGTDIDLDFEV
jgi:hypothetical protein